MNVKAHSSIWGYLYHEGKQTLTHGMGDLDMKEKTIINLGEPRARHHAATAGYVTNYVSHLNNVKLEKAGDSMSGTLDMGHNKITNVGAPTDETDVTNKQYVDNLIQHEHDTKPYDLGRYIVFPHDDGTKVYFSVRARKKIDLDNGKLVEVKHNINDISENEFKARDDIELRKDVTLLQNPDKKLGTMELRSPLRISFDPQKLLQAPWTLLFSVRPGLTPPRKNDCYLNFFTGQNTNIIRTEWELESFRYTVGTNENTHSIDNTELNHIALEYTGNKLCMWLNGMQKDMRDTVLGGMAAITMGVEELGILSLYNRNLSKQEIVQHFVDHHVQNFTDNEVLI